MLKEKLDADRCNECVCSMCFPGSPKIASRGNPRLTEPSGIFVFSLEMRGLGRGSGPEFAFIRETRGNRSSDSWNAPFRADAKWSEA